MSELEILKARVDALEKVLKCFGDQFVEHVHRMPAFEYSSHTGEAYLIKKKDAAPVP